MSSSRLCQVIKRTKSLPLKLPQNSNLVIRTPASLTSPSSTSTSTPSLKIQQPIQLNVNLIPQWRDDGHITLEQYLPSSNVDSDVDSDVDSNIDWKVQVTNQEKKKELTDVDILIDYKNNINDTTNSNNDNNDNNDNETIAEEVINDENSNSENSNNNKISSPRTVTLNATIPEKCNVSCYLHNDGGGNINILKKLEGEYGFDLQTKNGNINIHNKLRGDDIQLICDDGGLIHVKKSCEAQNINVRIGNSKSNSNSSSNGNEHVYNRFRSKMINASNANIEVYESQIQSQPNNVDSNNNNVSKLDDDDGLSIIDISSIYASQSGDGVHLNVERDIASTASVSAMSNDENDNNKTKEYVKKVRVKSNHGHISIRAATSIYNTDTTTTESSFEDEFGQRCVLVDLGGVNGSFDVSLESRGHNGGMNSGKSISSDDSSSGSGANNIKPLASNIHVDSLSPGQISILTSDDGDVGLTLDRKVESDIRLLSCPMMNDLDPNVLTEEKDDDVVNALIEHDNDIEDFYMSTNELGGDGKRSDDGDSDSDGDGNDDYRIKLETNAFSGHRSVDFTNVEYVHGHVENRSEEPDSRFDVKTKGTQGIKSMQTKPTGSVGKINIQGAAGQALEGFSGSGGSGDGGEFERPLVAIGTNGKIKMESLSWFGAISRRYGVKDEVNELGRQAKAGGASTRKQ